jgi:hypothetical protein
MQFSPFVFTKPLHFLKKALANADSLNVSKNLKDILAIFFNI